MQSEEFGLKTAMLKNQWLGVYNGYVGLPKNHMLFGLHYDIINESIDVHGGLTWSADHLPNQQPDGLWWVGFDTAHAGDVVPGYDALPLEIRQKMEQFAKLFVAATFGCSPDEVGDIDHSEDEFRGANFAASEVSYLAFQLAGYSVEKLLTHKGSPIDFA